jgi:lysophospholipase L1-like esterase
MDNKVATSASTSQTPTTKRLHIVLVGDSTLDNQSYVSPGPPVIQQLRAKLPSGASATLVARDGDVVDGVISRQVARVPADATHIFLSVGGNDGLRQMDVLQQRVQSVQGAVLKISQIQNTFIEKYNSMLDKVLALGLPTTIFSIYRPCYLHPDPMRRMRSLGMDTSFQAEMQKAAETSLCILNDVIYTCAIERGLPLIDLKTMFNEEKYYANPIEPSCEGGNKIVEAILQVVNEHDFSKKRMQAFN